MATILPNVRGIIPNDQRWDALGVVPRELGERALFLWLKTPNLARLAGQGVQFANTFVSSSLCSSGRATMLNG